MKVILKTDVAKVGRKGEVKEVANGYAQNFLIARGLADAATPQKIAAAQKAVQVRSDADAAARKKLEAALKKLNTGTITIHASANEKDTLFEALHAEAIAAHLKDVAAVDVPTEAIVIDAPIKTVGEHTVHIAVGEERAPLSVTVVAA